MVQQHSPSAHHRISAITRNGFYTIDAEELEKYLAGVDLPCDKQALMACARNNDAPQAVLEVLAEMEQFSDEDYQPPVDENDQPSRRH